MIEKIQIDAVCLGWIGHSDFPVRGSDMLSVTLPMAHGGQMSAHRP